MWSTFSGWGMRVRGFILRPVDEDSVEIRTGDVGGEFVVGSDGRCLGRVEGLDLPAEGRVWLRNVFVEQDGAEGSVGDVAAEGFWVDSAGFH